MVLIESRVAFLRVGGLAMRSDARARVTLRRGNVCRLVRLGDAMQ